MLQLYTIVKTFGNTLSDWELKFVKHCLQNPKYSGFQLSVEFDQAKGVSIFAFELFF